MSSSTTTDRDEGRGGYGFLVAASLIIIIAGMKLGREIIVPVVLAAFLAIVCMPIVNFLRRRHLPGWLAILLTFVFMLAIIGIVSLVVIDSVTNLAGNLEVYQSKLDTGLKHLKGWLESEWGLEFAQRADREPLDPAVLLGHIRTYATMGVSALTAVAFVVLLAIFMLFEAVGLPGKVRRALGNPNADLSQGQFMIQQIYGYLGVKTAISAVTGTLFAVALYFVGVPNPALWGFLAFVFNYIPNIGSVLAAIPPVLVGFAEGGVRMALGVVVANILVNQVMGNVVEPKVTGDRLGLSPLVVLLSLFFWSWLWGPVGMFLSVPLTMIVKILLEHTPSTRSWALLLGPSSPSDQELASGPPRSV